MQSPTSGKPEGGQLQEGGRENAGKEASEEATGSWSELFQGAGRELGSKAFMWVVPFLDRSTYLQKFLSSLIRFGEKQFDAPLDARENIGSHFSQRKCLTAQDGRVQAEC